MLEDPDSRVSFCAFASTFFWRGRTKLKLKNPVYISGAGSKPSYNIPRANLFALPQTILVLGWGMNQHVFKSKADRKDCISSVPRSCQSPEEIKGVTPSSLTLLHKRHFCHYFCHLAF